MDQNGDLIKNIANFLEGESDHVHCTVDRVRIVNYEGLACRFSTLISIHSFTYPTD